MKKKVGLLVLALTLLLSGMNVQAAEKENNGNIGKYFNFFVNELMGKEQEESLSSLIGSVEELVKDVEPKEVEKLIAFVEQQIQKGNWDSEEGIREAISQGEKEFKVTLTESQKSQILNIIAKVKQLGISPDFLLDQAKKIYEKYGKEIKEESANAGKDILKDAKDKVQEEVKKSIADYFSDMVQSVKSFFKGIFNR